MNAFATFLQADWTERAGWSLLHSLWQIAVVAAIYAITTFLLRNRSADCRYVVGCVAILLMLGLPAGTYVLLSHDSRSETAEVNTTPVVVASPTESAKAASSLAEAASVSTSPLPRVTHGDFVPAEPAPAQTPITGTTTFEAAVAAQPVTTDLFSKLRHCLPWITATWLTGVLLLLLRPLWGWFHVRRLMRRGLSPVSDTLRHAGQRVKERLGVNQAVRLVKSALVEVPTVVGCLRPMILLPASAISGLSTAQLELILAHELAHVKRHDWLVNFAQTMIEVLLFYHPAMWWVSNRVRVERENCCDDMAVAVSNDRTSYARALACLEESRSVTTASVLSATGGSLLRRVRRLMGEPSGEFGSATAGIWFLTLAILFVAVLLTTSYVRAWSEADSLPQGELISATVDEAEGVVAAYKGPCDVAASPDGKRLYVVENDARALAVVSIAEGKVVRTIPLPDKPTGVCVSPDGKSACVTCGAANGLLCLVDTLTAKVTAKLPVGHSPRGPCLSPNGERVYVCNRFDNNVSVIDLVAKQEVARVRVLREPFDSAITPDGRTLFVTNHLPNDEADSSDVACEVSCIDTSTFQAEQIRMLNGNTNLSGVCVSPDGKYAYAVSVLARYQMPRTQVERGWAATSALTIIDATKKAYINTVLLDEYDLGAANPYDVATSADGSVLFVSHAGTHEVSVINATAMLEKLLALPSRQLVPDSELGRRAKLSVEDVPNTLAFLKGIRQRVKLEGVGPRGLAVVGSRAYCAMYFSDTLGCVAMKSIAVPLSEIALGPTPVMTDWRTGELYFQDARLCSEQWLSCATCHPDGRADGLNWDLLSDGLGNPKGTKSMLLAHKTPPMMISGERADAETAVRAAFRHIQFEVVPEEKAKAVDAYLKSLRPTPSPYLVNGALSESAERGRALFESTEIGCATCHPAPLYTDLKMHDVKTRGPFDRRDTWDTPTLIECWRTGPYLHDGRYTTVKDVLAKGNHGEAADRLSDSQIDDLAQFVLSLSNGSTGPSANIVKGVLPPDTDDVAVEGMPVPSPVPANGESMEVIRDEAPPSSDDAVQAVLLPGEFKYGKQSLTVHTTNDSSTTQFLAPGDYPQEILVDGVTYRMARYDVGWYALKPRPILPRSRDHGSAVSLPKTSADGEEVEPIQLNGSVFDRPKVWMNYENRMPLQLTPDKHTVQAVFYLLDPKTGRRGRRVLSNAIEIGADGRAIEIDTTRPEAHFRDVRIRMLGGEARKPLAGLELTVSCGGMESYTSTTERDGGAAFRLPYGYYRASFTSPRDLPYLPFRYDSMYPCGNTRPIHVARTPGQQAVDLVLADPCELVLRAVDADTGEGIPGVRFALESMYGEMWAVPIRDETIRARPKDRPATQVADDEKPLDTDEQGYFRRYVGPRHDEWSYWVEVSPDGYRLVSPRGDVKIDTSLGKKRAEQTFVFRRGADATRVD
jgi:YVTN family beta-propeller protein